MKLNIPGVREPRGVRSAVGLTCLQDARSLPASLFDNHAKFADVIVERRTLITTIIPARLKSDGYVVAITESITSQRTITLGGIMPTLHDLEVFITMNEDGDFAVDVSDDDAFNACVETHGGEAFRTVRLMVTMAAPEITAVAVRVPDDADEIVPVTAAE